jgi:hypothetical protein
LGAGSGRGPLRGRVALRRAERKVRPRLPPGPSRGA